MRLSGTVIEIWRLKVYVQYTNKHTETQTDTQNDGQNDQSHNLLQCSLTFTLGGDKLESVVVCMGLPRSCFQFFEKGNRIDEETTACTHSIAWSNNAGTW